MKRCYNRKKAIIFSLNNVNDDKKNYLPCRLCYNRQLWRYGLVKSNYKLKKAIIVLKKVTMTREKVTIVPKKVTIAQQVDSHISQMVMRDKENIIMGLWKG